MVKKRPARGDKLLRNSIFAVFIIIMDKKDAPNVGVQMLSVRASGGGHSVGFARIVSTILRVIGNSTFIIFSKSIYRGNRHSLS
jgi:hypothetical protein